MHIFYSGIRRDDKFILDENDSRHLTRVLRLSKGDEVNLINGSGSLFLCKVFTVDKSECHVEIVSEQENYKLRNYNLHIAIAPTKNIDRFEWFVEKSIEFGIDTISPIICERSERRVLKVKRSERIAISAMKQSIKTQMTSINEAVNYKDFIKKVKAKNKYIAHCNSGEGLSILEKIYSKGEDLIIMIGPEGDFSSAEVSLALEYGFKELDLGKSRFRTETAGIAACSFVYSINQ